MKKYSEKWSLNAQNWLHGLILAVIVAVLTLAKETIAAKSFTFDITEIASVAGTAAAGYILKKFQEGQPTAIEIDPNKTEVIEKPAN